jgi:YidC/Oxa1 family membrane protein insertase
MSELFQQLLDGLGAVLAFLYDLVPNYGIAIILFTLGIRLLLLPLGIKQVRSMQAMQALQPKMKQLQQKYKGDRARMNEELMALYREHGVNPLSGCLPLLAQLPVLFALFAVLRFPTGMTHIPHSDTDPVVSHPPDSALYVAIHEDRTFFLGTNLLCSATQAGKQVSQAQVTQNQVPDAPPVLDCGHGWPSRIPYYALALAMIGTTFYQQRQMARASPGGNPQQQMLTRIMPLLFGVWGFLFPAGLVVYWITTNVVQIGQQQFLLRQRRSQELALGDGKAAGAVSSKSAGSTGKGTPKGSSTTGKRPTSGTRGSGGRPQSGKGTSGGRPSGASGKPKGTGSSKGQGSSKTPRTGSGGSGGNGQGGSASGGADPGGGDGSRKKRPNR